MGTVTHTWWPSTRSGSSSNRCRGATTATGAFMSSKGPRALINNSFTPHNLFIATQSRPKISEPLNQLPIFQQSTRPQRVSTIWLDRTSRCLKDYCTEVSTSVRAVWRARPRNKRPQSWAKDQDPSPKLGSRWKWVTERALKEWRHSSPKTTSGGLGLARTTARCMRFSRSTQMKISDLTRSWPSISKCEQSKQSHRKCSRSRRTWTVSRCIPAAHKYRTGWYSRLVRWATPAASTKKGWRPLRAASSRVSGQTRS